MLKSTDYLNKKLYLNLAKRNEAVSITYNDTTCFYTKLTTNTDFRNHRFCYTLNPIGSSTFEFELNVVALYKGSFEIELEDESYIFKI